MIGSKSPRPSLLHLPSNNLLRRSTQCWQGRWQIRLLQFALFCARGAASTLVHLRRLPRVAASLQTREKMNRPRRGLVLPLQRRL
jgi:hypothetical protein